MKRLFAENALNALYKAKAFLLLSVLLTGGLTNCAKSTSHTSNDIQMIEDENFEADDTSKVLIEPQNIEKIASTADNYYLVEKGAVILDDNDPQKYLGKNTISYSIDHAANTFTYTFDSTEKNPQGSFHTVIRKTFSSIKPYAFQYEEYNLSTKILSRPELNEEISNTLSCDDNDCQITKTRNEDYSEESIPRKKLILPTLKELLILPLTALNKLEFPSNKLKIKYTAMGRFGLVMYKQILRFHNPSDDTHLFVTQIEKDFNVIHKSVLTYKRNSILQEKKEDMTKTILVDKIAFDKIEEKDLSAGSTKIEVANLSKPKAIDFYKAVVVGDGRFLVQNNDSQEVVHKDHASYIELNQYRQKDTTTPEERHTNTDLSKEISPSWIGELDLLMAKAVSFDEKIQTIITFLRTHMSSRTMMGTLNAEEVADLKVGDCSEMSRQFVIIARNYGLAARLKEGFIFPTVLLEKDLEMLKHPQPIGHVWAEVYNSDDEEAKGWTYVDTAVDAIDTQKKGILFDIGEIIDINSDFENYGLRNNSYIYFVFDEKALEKVNERIEDQVKKKLVLN